MAQWTEIANYELDADQSASISYEFDPGYDEIRFSICAAPSADNTNEKEDLILFTDDNNSNQPRFSIKLHKTNWALTFGQITTKPLQMLKGVSTWGGKKEDSSGTPTVSFEQLARFGKVTKFWLLYNAAGYLPSGSIIRIWGR